jgi:iron(III) transport system ATP-binding protein
MAISDNIILMKKGVIAQMGSPTEIYYHPNSEFVADFIGECNFLKGTISAVRLGEADVNVNGVDLSVVTDKAVKVGDEGEIVLRPEAIVLDDKGMLPCTVELSCFMGSYQNYHVRVGNTLVKITDNCPINKKVFHVGDRACISFDKICAHLL